MQHAIQLKGMTKSKAVFKSAIWALIVACSIEIIQPLAGRNFELNDILNGVFGILLACLAGTAKDWRYRTVSFLLFGFLAGSVIGWASVPAFNAYATLKWRQEMFPVLALFESPLERPLWKKITESTQIEFDKFPICENQYCLKLTTPPEGWSGVEYRAECLNWTDYKFLSLAIYTEEALELNIRIDDDGDVKNYEDRFNGKVRLSKGSNLVAIPISQISRAGGARELNVKCISRVLVFVGKESQSKVVFIAKMQLL